MTLRKLAFSIALGLLSACGDSTSEAQECEADVERRCDCTSGVSGIQNCLEGKWTVCACWPEDNDASKGD